MTDLLLVEDDEVIGEEIVGRLRPQGFTVRWSRKLSDSSNEVAATEPDLIILDRRLPDGDGLELLRDWRAKGIRAPALVLSALDRVDHRVEGLRAGGDDYLVKPFAFDELVARLEALLRRPTEMPQIRLRLGSVEANLIASTARRGQRELNLLPREFKLLVYLMKRHDQVVTREMLFRELWNYKFTPRSNLVDVHMSRLRRKLDSPDEPPLIQSVRGMGFKFVACP